MDTLNALLPLYESKPFILIGVNMEPKYKYIFHFRYYGKNGSIEPLPKGGCTIAVNEVPEGYSYGISLCCKKDNFVRRLGRHRAAGFSLSSKYANFTKKMDDKHLRKFLNNVWAVMKTYTNKNRMIEDINQLFKIEQ